MSDQNKYDDLDNFFRKYLNQNSNAQEEAWSIPPDEVWERAMPHFKEEKKKKGLAFWLALGAGSLAIALILMSIVLFRMNDKINHLEQEQAIIKEQQQANAILNKEKNTINLSNTATSNISTLSNKDESVESIKQVKDNTVNSDANTSFTTNPNTIKDNFRSQAIKLKRAPKNEGNQREDNSTIFSYLASKPIRSLENSTLKDLGSLEIQSGVKSIDFKNIENEDALTFDKKLPKTPKYLDTRKSFAHTLGFELMYFAPTLMDFSRGSINNPVLRGYNNWSWSKGFGLNIVYQFNNKWSVTSGVARSSINKQFLAYGIESYDQLNNRFLKDGQIENRMILDVSSPVGDMDEEVIIRTTRRGLLPHNTPVILDGCIMHNLDIVRVPVGIRYNVFKIGHLQLNTEIGIGYNIITSNNYNVDYDIIINDERITERDYDLEIKTPMSNDIWDAMLTLGLQQRIGNHWNWNWNVSYTHSLHKVSNNITAQEMSYWKGLRFQMGIGYTLE